MGENTTIGLLTNINNSLGKIVQLMLPQNKDAQKKQQDSVKNLSQGGLNSGSSAAQTASATTGTINGIDIAKVVSSLDGLPEQVRLIARLSGKTIDNFKEVLTVIIGIFTQDEIKSLDKSTKMSIELIKALNGLKGLPQAVQDVSKISHRSIKKFKNTILEIVDIFSQETFRSVKSTDKLGIELLKTLTELGKLPTALKDVSKIKERDVKKFAKVVTHVLEMIGKTLRNTKVSKDDVELALKTGETLLALTSAMKSLAKMTLIAPLAMIGLVAMTPVWLAFSGLLALIGKMGPAVNKGLRTLRNVDRFMNSMMKTALLGIAVAGGVILLGMVVKKHYDLMLFGLAGLLTVFIGVGAIAVLGGLIGLLIKSTKMFDKQIIKFTLELMLIAGLTIVLGMLLQVGWKQALIGLGGMIVIMVSMLGILALINIIGEVSMSSIKSMGGVMLLVIISMAIAALCVVVGKYIEENWDYALVGFAATTAILGEVLGLAYLANRVARHARKGVMNLLICEGVILAAEAIIWATIKTGELVWEYFGSNTKEAVAKVAIIGVVTTAIIYGALGVTRIANRASKDIKKGALSLLMAEGVILAAALVATAVIGVSLLMKKTDSKEILITMTVMSAIVSGAGVVAAVASSFDTTIKKGAIVMAVLELLILGMVGVTYAVTKVAKSANEVGWDSVLYTVGTMALLIGGFTAIIAALGAIIANPIAMAVLGAGAAMLTGISLLIFMITGATKRVIELDKMMQETGKNSKYYAEFLQSVTHDIFSYENLSPSIGGREALRLAAKYMALMPVFRGMSAMIRVVSNMARQFGGMVEITNANGDGIGKYGIRPFYGMNGTTPIYGEPVYIPEIADQIVTSVNAFADKLYEGFKGVNLLRLAEIGATIGYIVDPVSKFAQMLTGLTAGKTPDTLVPVFVIDGDIRTGEPVKLDTVAGLIASSISTFATTLFGDGKELPQWMYFTRNRRGRNRIENAMNTLALIVEPIDKFVQLLTSYASDGPGMIRKIEFDENGDVKKGAPAVNVIEVAKAIGGSINDFVKLVFSDDAKWMKQFKNVDSNGETKGLRAMKSLAMVLTPVSAFVEAMCALEPDGNNLYAVTVDDSGISHRRPVDIVGTATKIAEGISVFVDKLFSTDNVTAWENMIYVTKGMTTGDSEDSSGAVGVLSVVIDPISNFVNALCLIGGERGEAGTLAIPIYDSNGKLVNTRVIDLEFTAETIAKSISVFLKTLFSQENQTVWKSLMYGYDTAGNLGTVKNEDLKESIGVFAAIIDPIVSFMDVITKFGGTPEKFMIYDGKKPRSINLKETATSIGEVIKVFVTRMKTAFESITEFNDDQRRDVTNFATSIGSILENFAKVGDIDKDKIDKASLVIDTYFNTVEKISEKLKIEVPEKEKINGIDNMIKRGVSMFKVFEGIDFKNMSYENGSEAVLRVFVQTSTMAEYASQIPDDFSFDIVIDFIKASRVLHSFFNGDLSVKSFNMSLLDDYINSMTGIAFGFQNIPVIPRTEENINRLWFVHPFVSTAMRLSNMLASDVNATNAALTISLVSKIGSAMIELGAVSAQELDKVSKSYYTLLERVIKLSDKKNTKSVNKMSDALKDATTQMTKFDKQLVQKAEDRKKKLDELIEKVADLNDKLAETGKAMTTISERLDDINKIDAEKIRKNVDAANGGGSSAGNTGGFGNFNNNSGGGAAGGGIASEPVPSIDSKDIEDAIINALKAFKLTTPNITIAQDPTASVGSGSASYVINGFDLYADVESSGDHYSK